MSRRLLVERTGIVTRPVEGSWGDLNLTMGTPSRDFPSDCLANFHAEMGLNSLQKTHFNIDPVLLFTDGFLSLLSARESAF